MKILVLNGPNINMLGIREPEVYGKDTYASLERLVSDYGKEKGVDIEVFQSNHEGILIDKIQAALGNADGIVFNPGGYTHTSVALLDAIKAVSIPTVEVHITDVDSREEFRRFSYISLAAVKTIKGHGLKGYTEAVQYLIDNI